MSTASFKPAAEVDSVPVAEIIPPYTTVTELKENSNGEACHHEKKSQTPRLDAYAQKPEVQARILAISEALRDVAHGTSCTKCASKTVVQALCAQLYDMKAAKKSGAITAHERKEMKKEAKLLMKDLKEMKRMWKTK